MIAGGVDAVGKEHDCLATGNSIQALVHDHIDSIVQLCAIPGAGTPNCITKPVTIARKLGKYVHLIIERHNHHAIVWAKLIGKGNGGVLNVLKPKTSRATGVDHQHD